MLISLDFLGLLRGVEGEPQGLRGKRASFKEFTENANLECLCFMFIFVRKSLKYDVKVDLGA